MDEQTKARLAELNAAIGAGLKVGADVSELRRERDYLRDGRGDLVAWLNNQVRLAEALARSAAFAAEREAAAERQRDLEATKARQVEEDLRRRVEEEVDPVVAYRRARAARTF